MPKNGPIFGPAYKSLSKREILPGMQRSKCVVAWTACGDDCWHGAWYSRKALKANPLWYELW